MDLGTSYLGLRLRNPLVPSRSPLSEDIDNIRRMEDAGAAAVVLHSLFEEQLVRDRYELYHHLTAGTESFAEALTYFPEPPASHLGPDEYLQPIRKAKAAVDIPIIASLNGGSLGGWTTYARKCRNRAPTRRSSTSTSSRRISPARPRRSNRRISHPLRREVGRDDPRGAETRALLQQHGAHCSLARRLRRRCFSLIQPILTSRSRDVGGAPSRVTEHPAGDAAAVDLVGILYGRIRAD
jgi:hypothetical protein